MVDDLDRPRKPTDASWDLENAQLMTGGTWPSHGRTQLKSLDTPYHLN